MQIEGKNSVFGHSFAGWMKARRVKVGRKSEVVDTKVGVGTDCGQLE
jgi:hypothetical protein